jgi:hypothetical protein
MPTLPPTTWPKIVYNSVTLWLPRKFTDWDNHPTYNPQLAKGFTYTQVASYPLIYEVKARTAVFNNTAITGGTWDGTNTVFLTAWATFYAWAGIGKVFSFYRKGTDSTAGLSYFQYCVWTQDWNGVKLLPGNERYTLDIEFRTETAAR